MIYPDLGFTTSLVVLGERSAEANRHLRDVAPPISLSLLHRIQIENALLRLGYDSDDRQARIARDGLRTWRRYLIEQVFVIREFNLEAAFATASRWNAGFETKPPKWSLLLHVAVAAGAGASFLSFEPDLRAQAVSEGLAVLPENLST